MQSTPHSEFFNTLAGVRRILEPEIVALAARHASRVQVDDTRVALDTVMNVLTPL